MDDLPYEFIDRVFTKLRRVDIPAVSVQSPLWMEARRVYEQNLKMDLAVMFYLSEPELKYRIVHFYGETATTEFTFADVAAMDQRFVRITTICIAQSDFRALKVENPTEFLQFISSFTMDHMILDVANDPNKFLNECCKYELKYTSLIAEYSPNAVEFLKSQLKSAELEHVSLSGNSWPPELMEYLEVYVCRPEFKYLECDEKCMDADCLKRIVAYWKTMERPWKPATIEVNYHYDHKFESRFGRRDFEDCRGLMVKSYPTYSIFYFHSH